MKKIALLGIVLILALSGCTKVDYTFVDSSRATVEVSTGAFYLSPGTLTNGQGQKICEQLRKGLSSIRATEVNGRRIKWEVSCK